VYRHKPFVFVLTGIGGAGTVSFWWKVSSESGYDELEFYPDDVRQHSISGEIICRPGPLSGRIAT